MSLTRPLMLMVLGLRATLLRLADALTPASLLVLDRTFGMARTRLLEAAVRLGIAGILETEGPLGPEALAGRVKAEANALGRALRALASMGIFRILPDGRFANNRASRALIPGRKGSVDAFVAYFASESNSRAWENLEHSLLTGKSAFEKAHGETVWDRFSRSPEEGAAFGSAMRGLTEIEAPLIARGYPFESFKSVCDVGGGSGTLLGEILKTHPGIDAFVYDLAGGTVTAGRPGIRRVEGDFFENVPEGPDAYLLKDVLHDWDDARALRILGSIRRAMSAEKRLLVIEMLLEPLSLEPSANLSDIHMMVACSEGRQRSTLEMDRLLRKAGFAVERVIALPSAYSIVEARLVS